MKKDSIKDSFSIDTTQYKKHKSGFYVSKKGDIYQLDGLPFEDSSGGLYMKSYLDSLMFYGEYPNKKPLRYIIDLETFTKDSLSSFEWDKKFVYYARGSSDGTRRFIVEGVNPKTFKSINEYYGKDDLHVFYNTHIVKTADLKSFVASKNSNSAQDKNHKYYLGERIKN